MAPDYKEVRTYTEALIHGSTGFAKGFATYLIPLTILKKGRVNHSIIRRSIALGLYIGVFRLTNKVIHVYCTRYQTKCQSFIPRRALDIPSRHMWIQTLHKFRFAIAAAVSAAVAINSEARPSSKTLAHNSTFVFWCIVRAIRCIIPEWAVHPAGSTFFVCLSAAQILSTWIDSPEQLDPNYLRFLNHHGGKTKETLAVMKAVSRSGKPIANGYACEVIHGDITTSCLYHSINFFYHSFFRTMKVYTFLYIALMAASFSPRGLSVQLQSYIKNVLRSSAFLSTYCTVAWLSACLAYRYVFSSVNRPNLLMHTWAAGLAGLIERPSRRVELATYCMAYAVDSAFRWALENKLFPSLPAGPLGTLSISLASAILLHNHKQQPAGIMKWFFGIHNTLASQ